MGTKKGQKRKTARKAYETKGGTRFYEKRPNPLPKSQKGLRAIFVRRGTGWEHVPLPWSQKMEDWWSKNITLRRR